MYVARCRDDGVEDLGCCFFVLFVAPAGMCVCVCVVLGWCVLRCRIVVLMSSWMKGNESMDDP